MNVTKTIADAEAGAAALMTLDLSNVPPEQWGSKVFNALKEVNKERAAMIPPVDPLQREIELKILRSKERQLTAQLQDCHDRIEQLTERPKVDADYIASIVDCQGGDVELLTAAHKSGHLHLTGRRWFDAPVMAEFQRCYEQHNKMVGAV